MHTLHLRAHSPVRRPDEAAQGQAGDGALPPRLFVGSEISDRKRLSAKALLDTNGHGLSNGEPADGGERSPYVEGFSRRFSVAMLSHWTVSTPVDDPRHPDGRACASRPGRQCLLFPWAKSREQRPTGRTHSSHRP